MRIFNGCINAAVAPGSAGGCPLMVLPVAAQQSDVSQLLEESRSVSVQLSRDVAQMESFTRII